MAIPPAVADDTVRAVAAVRTAATRLAADLPSRRPTDALTLEAAAADITTFMRLVAALTRAIALVGGDRDSLPLREGIGLLLRGMNGRLPGLQGAVTAAVTAATRSSSPDRLRWDRVAFELENTVTAFNRQSAAFSSRLAVCGDPPPLRTRAASGSASPAAAATVAAAAAAASGGGTGGSGGSSTRRGSSTVVAPDVTAPCGSAAAARGGADDGGRLASAMAMAGEVDVISAIVDERAEAIDHVSGQVAEVAELFHDIATLVAGQSEGVRKLEANTAEAKAHTAGAVRQLEEARRYQSEAPCVIM